MRFRPIDIIKYAVPLLVAYLLLRYYVFKEVSLAEMVAVFRTADYRWVAGSGVALLLAHLSRAYRWRLLLQPLGYAPGLPRMFLAVMIGYFANLLLPRMGEVTRCGALQKMDRVPLNAGIGTVVAERLFDVLMLLLLLGLNFLLEFDRLSTFFMDFFSTRFGAAAQVSAWFYLVLTAGVLAFAGILFWLYRRREKLWRIPLLVRTKDFFLGMWEGIVGIRKMERKWDFVLHSLLIWFCYYLAAYLLTFALPGSAPLSPLAGLTILMTGSLGMAAPVQGGAGPYHLMVSSALMLYGWNREDGIVLATFIWASQTLMTVLVGGLCFAASLFVKPAVTTEPQG